jgi:hypothetical protein
MNSILLFGVRGQMGKQIVVKRYGKKTGITAYPDITNNNDPMKRELYARKVKKNKQFIIMRLWNIYKIIVNKSIGWH